MQVCDQKINSFYVNFDIPVIVLLSKASCVQLSKLQQTLNSICLEPGSQHKSDIHIHLLNAAAAESQPQGGFQQIAWNVFCWLRDLKQHQTLNPYRLVCHSATADIPSRQTLLHRSPAKCCHPSSLLAKARANRISWYTLKPQKSGKKYIYSLSYFIKSICLLD